MNVIDKLKMKQYRDTTRKNYLRVWRLFNNFLLKLDEMPQDWENRTTLFIGHLINEGMQSSTIKSYVSAIKKLLVIDGYKWRDDLVLLGTLTRACRLTNDRVCTRLPIHCSLLELILFEFQREFSSQPYLQALYKALFALGYYGLMRVRELTINEGNHAARAANVHIASNKQKMLILLYTSKTHSEAVIPQKIKISALQHEKQGGSFQRHFCPFRLLREYVNFRGNYITADKPFFVFSDHSAVKAEQARKLLKKAISKIGLNAKHYDVHGLRIGRASDLIKAGYSVEEVKRLGRWKSNAVYRYIKI